MPHSQLGRSVLTGLLVLGLSVFHAPVLWGQVPLTGTYTQSFDTLSNTGNNNPWVDNVTLPGWYSSRTVYQASDGTGNTGDLYSFGTTGSVERALGSINGGSTGNIVYAIQFQNLTGLTITSLSVAYVGEQWRNGGQNAEADTILFDYLVTAAGGNQIGAAGYTSDPSMDFTNIVSQNPAGPLDGNLPANQLPRNTILTLNWAPNDFLWIRWTDTEKQGNDHGLGIDNFAVAVPEPATIGLIVITGGGALVGLRRMRARRGRYTKSKK